MKLKIFAILIFGFLALHLQAQTDEPSQPINPTDPFSEMEELFRNFGFGDMDGGMMMDTMIIKQFGNGFDMEMGEMDQMMQEMMKMMQEQFQQLDFGNMDGFDHLFEDFDMDNLDPNGLNADPNAPGLSEEEREKLKKKKKRKTYKL